jgi:hypothetical protein
VSRPPHTIVAAELLNARDLFKPVMNDCSVSGENVKWHDSSVPMDSNFEPQILLPASGNAGRSFAEADDMNDHGA